MMGPAEEVSVVRKRVWISGSVIVGPEEKMEFI
jgi:hypothetical protein